jgi:hypothetical protein
MEKEANLLQQASDLVVLARRLEAVCNDTEDKIIGPQPAVPTGMETDKSQGILMGLAPLLNDLGYSLSRLEGTINRINGRF